MFLDVQTPILTRNLEDHTFVKEVCCSLEPQGESFICINSSQNSKQKHDISRCLTIGFSIGGCLSRRISCPGFSPAEI